MPRYLLCIASVALGLVGATDMGQQIPGDVRDVDITSSFYYDASDAFGVALPASSEYLGNPANLEMPSNYADNANPLDGNYPPVWGIQGQSAQPWDIPSQSTIAGQLPPTTPMQLQSSSFGSNPWEGAFSDILAHDLDTQYNIVNQANIDLSASLGSDYTFLDLQNYATDPTYTDHSALSDLESLQDSGNQANVDAELMDSAPVTTLASEASSGVLANNLAPRSITSDALEAEDIKASEPSSRKRRGSSPHTFEVPKRPLGVRRTSGSSPVPPPSLQRRPQQHGPIYTTLGHNQFQLNYNILVSHLNNLAVQPVMNQRSSLMKPDQAQIKSAVYNQVSTSLQRFLFTHPDPTLHPDRQESPTAFLPVPRPLTARAGEPSVMPTIHNQRQTKQLIQMCDKFIAPGDRSLFALYWTNRARKDRQGSTWTVAFEFIYVPTDVNPYNRFLRFWATPRSDTVVAWVNLYDEPEIDYKDMAESIIAEYMKKSTQSTADQGTTVPSAV
ncbi:hypothetical protein IWQ60_007795 [Tieghemiomyces parasiticus]|uniref:Uncharacterized protein n=1 Tax=Tieghemiomyces parasiticus TaxID=78921 RepID=A0A9W7ZVF0_9FUNG|nr:hypothetical protein IWQ60_007795 [Tieghemiomyces parasiticus]